MQRPHPDNPATPPLLLLIGLRASGKSTVGRLVAQSRACAFTDLDDAVLRALNAPTVADAWRSAGEPAFRAAETQALRSLLEHTDAPYVIALGGGTPTAPGATDLIRDAQRNRAALVIYLRADAATLRARLAQGAGANRPSLTGASPLDEIQTVLNQRNDAYTRLADEVIDPLPSAHETAQKVMSYW